MVRIHPKLLLRIGIVLFCCIIWLCQQAWGTPSRSGEEGSFPLPSPTAQGMPALGLLYRLQTPSMFLHPPFRGSARLTNGFDHHRPASQFQPGHFVSVTGETFVPSTTHTCGKSDGHAGYDWQMAEGKPILAAADGWIIQAGLEPSSYCPLLDRPAQGLWVVLSHRIPGPDPDRYQSIYSHLSQVRVRTGQWVRAGSVIGLAGSTGCSTGPHLHFEIRRLSDTNDGTPTPVDPYGWRGKGSDPWATHPEGALSEVLWLPGRAPSLGPCSSQNNRSWGHS